MNILEQLKSVLCDPSGKCCITGSDEDRAIVDRALQALAEQSAQREPLLREIAALSANALDDYKTIQKLMAERQPLTDEEIEACIHHVDEDGIGLFAFARAIEAAHGIKEPQPPVTQRPWVSLTKEEVNSWELPDCPTVFEFVQFIEDKIKDKNT